MKIIRIILIFAFLISKAVALNPDKQYKVTPDEFGLSYEKIIIPTKDGMQLAAWFYKSTSDSKKIIIISGNGDGNMSKNIEIASLFISLGYNVISYDYRGFGESSDFKINNNFYIYAQFEKDLNAVIDYVRKYYSKFRQLDLYGQGIGAGLSIGVGCNRTEVNKIVADSPYNTLESIQKRYKDINQIEMLIPLAFDKYMLEPEYALAERSKNVAGLLFIYGEKDEIYSQKDIRILRKVAKCPTDEYKAVGANYENIFNSNKSKYLEALKTFLK